MSLLVGGTLLLSPPLILQAQERHPGEPREVRILALEEAVGIALTRSPGVRQARAQLQRDGAGEWEGVKVRWTLPSGPDFSIPVRG